MIDGIKVRVFGDSMLNLLSLDFLIFEKSENKIKAKYKGLIIEYYPNSLACYIRGSIHKFYNEGEHNADQFSRTDFILALKKLENELYISCKDIILCRIELGINILLPYPPLRFINMITLINGRMPIRQPRGLLVEYQQYSIKIYSKSKQCKLIENKNIIRIEIAYHKISKFYHDIQKIYSLEDLKSKYIWEKFICILKKTIEKITVFDYNEIKEFEIQLNEALLVYEWSNPVRLQQEINRVKKYRKVQKAMSIYEKYSSNNEYKLFLSLAINILEKLND